MRYAFAFIAGAAFAGVLTSTALRPRPAYAPACATAEVFGPAYVRPPPAPAEWRL